MYKITAPVSGYTGTGYCVQFVDGKGQTDDERIARMLADKGYTVEGLTDTDRPLDKLKKAELEAKAAALELDISALKTKEEILAAIMAKVAEGDGA